MVKSELELMGFDSIGDGESSSKIARKVSDLLDVSEKLSIN